MAAAASPSSVSTSTYIDLLNSALKKTNEQLLEEEEVIINSVPQQNNPSFVFLSLKKGEESSPFGIINLFESHNVLKTVNKVAQDILKTLDVYKAARKTKDFLITEYGVPIFTNNLNVKIDDNGYLVIDGTIVKKLKKDGRTTKFFARNYYNKQGVGYFEKLENGYYEIKSAKLTKLPNGTLEVTVSDHPNIILIDNEKIIH